MIVQVRNYIKNLFSVSKGIIVSVSELLRNRRTVKKIIKPLMIISVEDFLPVGGALLLRDGLLQLALSPSKEADTVQRALMSVVAATAYIVLANFFIKRIVRGTIRSIALSNAIPLLLSENRPLEYSYNDNNVIVSNLLRLSISEPLLDFVLPNNDFTKLINNLRIGYQIVTMAFNEKELEGGNFFQISTMYCLVGIYYHVSTTMSAKILGKINNNGVDLFINNVAYIVLLTVMANIKTKYINIPLQPDRYLVKPPSRQAFSSFLVELLRELLSSYNIKMLLIVIARSRDEIKKFVTYSFKLGLLPETIESPESLFNDKVISLLLESLPESRKAYIRTKCSKQAIETKLGEFETAITKRRASCTTNIYRFFEMERCRIALVSKVSELPQEDYDATSEFSV